MCMQQTQILLHIRAVFYSLFSLRNPDHMRKNKFYYTENTNFTTFSSRFFVFSLRNPDHVKNTNCTTFRWLEYVVKIVFAAKTITWMNPLSNTFCSKIYTNWLASCSFHGEAALAEAKKTREIFFIFGEIFFYGSGFYERKLCLHVFK